MMPRCLIVSWGWSRATSINERRTICGNSNWISTPEVLAVFPEPAPGTPAPVWLAQAAEVMPAVAVIGYAVGGIRIEDDVLITEDGCRVLGPGIPKTVAEVEAACTG